MVNYQNGKIYKIEDVGGNMCYIGSTTKQHLAQRMAEHRKVYTCYKNGKTNNYTVFDIFDIYGVENCRIVLIELCPCDTKDELTSREAHFIKTVECVNKMIPDRTKAEYGKKRYEENKEEMKLYSKQQREKNKDTIQAKKSLVIDCSCGKTYTFGHRTTHFNSKYHLKNVVNEALEV